MELISRLLRIPVALVAQADEQLRMGAGPDTIRRDLKLTRYQYATIDRYRTIAASKETWSNPPPPLPAAFPPERALPKPPAAIRVTAGHRHWPRSKPGTVAMKLAVKVLGPQQLRTPNTSSSMVPTVARSAEVASIPPISQYTLSRIIRAHPIGPLQIKILHCLWQSPASTAAEVRQWVNNTRPGESPLACTTILTVLRNLYKRELCVRVRDGRADRYTAAMKESRFKRTFMDVLCSQLWNGDTGAMASAAMKA